MIKTPIQIRFSDIDIMGHVNNALLQEYFDLGKSDYFKEVISLPLMWTDRGFVAATTTTTFSQEVMIEDEIVVYTFVEKIGTKSLTFNQEIKCNKTGEVKVYNSSVLVAFDMIDHKSMAVPTDWRESITKHEGWSER